MESVAPFERHRNAAKFFDPLSFMRREIDRVFDLASSNGWAGALDKNLPALRMDVAETDKEILVTAELPGVDREDVEVSLAPGLLIIKGEKRGERDEKKADYQIIERSFGAFERRVAVPDACDAAQVKAKFDKGVLTVRIPKPASAPEAAKIAIQVA